ACDLDVRDVRGADGSHAAAPNDRAVLRGRGICWLLRDGHVVRVGAAAGDRGRERERAVGIDGDRVAAVVELDRSIETRDAALRWRAAGRVVVGAAHHHDRRHWAAAARADVGDGGAGWAWET